MLKFNTHHTINNTNINQAWPASKTALDVQRCYTQRRAGAVGLGHDSGASWLGNDGMAFEAAIRG
jgi:hypothetical protein